MSQRRQDARRAQQERRRELERQRRQGTRRTPAAVAPRPAPPPPSRRQSLLTTRNIWIGAGALAAVIVVAVGLWVWSTTREPLPGQKFPSAGNDHLASIDEPHEPYTSNPPTSGPHLAPIPRPGIYKTAKRGEELGHFMEHGGVWVLYNCPQGCDAEVAELESLVNRAIDRGDPTAIAPFPDMEHKFAFVAWQYLLTMDELDIKQASNFVERLACNYAPEAPDAFCPVKRGSVASSSRNRSMAPSSATPFSVFGSPTPAASAAPSPTP